MAPTAIPQFGANHFLQLRQGRLSGVPRQDISTAFDALATDPHGKDKLVLYFHGGLDDEKAGMNIAQTFYPKLREAGAFPYFFVWRSGWREVIDGRLLKIVGEFVFKRIVDWVAEFALDKVMEAGDARAGGELELLANRDTVRDTLKQADRPFDDIKPEERVKPDAVLSDAQRAQFERLLRSDEELSAEAAGIARWLDQQEPLRVSAGERGDVSTVPAVETSMSPDVLDDIRREAAQQGQARGGAIWRLVKGGTKVLYHVIARFAGRTHHGFYPTVIEETLREFYFAEIGQIIWRYMKDDTAAAFGTDPVTFGGTAVLQELRRQWDKAVRPQIYLVGHSTGAVYTCHFLRHAARWLPDARFNVIWAAPACTCELFHSSLPYFKGQVQYLRCFGMQDDLERKDPLLRGSVGRYAYPYSLLYFVSGVVEKERDTPLVGMQRYHSGAAPYNGPMLLECRDYLQSQKSSTVWSKVAGAGPGLSSQAFTHGDFFAEKVTLDSLQAIVRGGF